MLITQKSMIYNTLKNVSFVFLILKMCLLFGQETPDKTILVIDPGHGGVDSGAIGENGILEKDVALDIAREIVQWNDIILDGRYDIYLTRYTDTLISLGDRTNLTKALQADVFVSLHCNDAENPEAKGMEVFVHSSHNSYSKESLALGVSILNEVVQNLGIRNRNVKSDNFHVLRENAFCPSVLVEMAFLSHRDEAEYILRVKNIRALALALAILLGIDNFKKLDL